MEMRESDLNYNLRYYFMEENLEFKWYMKNVLFCHYVNSWGKVQWPMAMANSIT